MGIKKRTSPKYDLYIQMTYLEQYHTAQPDETQEQCLEKYFFHSAGPLSSSSNSATKSPVRS